MLFRVKHRGEEGARQFGFGVTTQAIAEKDVESLCRSYPTICTYTYWDGKRDFVKLMLKLGVPVVVHDPAEFHEGFIEELKVSKSPVVVIRKSSERAIRKLGIDRATFIRHPYVRAPMHDNEKLLERGLIIPRVHAVSVARVDFRKHQDVIFQANDLLPAAHRCDVYGEVNRMYAYHKLNPNCPNWKRDYKGVADRDTTAVAYFRHAYFGVNLTTLKGDGGGTEYSMLECWDAGAILVVHKNWILPEVDAIRPGETALVAGTAKELADVLRGHYAPKIMRQSQEAELMLHQAGLVIPEYVRVCWGGKPRPV